MRSAILMKYFLILYNEVWQHLKIRRTQCANIFQMTNAWQIIKTMHELKIHPKCKENQWILM